MYSSSDPRDEPCHTCGRERDECICVDPDFLDDDPIRELDDPDYLSWGYHEEEIEYSEADDENADAESEYGAWEQDH